MGFFRQNLEGSYISEMAPTRRFLKGFFTFFLEETLITLSEMTQNLKNRACLIHNFMELDMKNFSDPRALTFGFWGLKISLGQFGRPFGKELSKPFLKNHEMNSIKLFCPILSILSSILSYLVLSYCSILSC